MKVKMNGFSLMTWEDLYYDGFLDPKVECFCEDTQEIDDHGFDDGWDKLEEDEEE